MSDILVELCKFEEWLANRRTRSFRFSPTSKARSHALDHQWPITFVLLSSSHELGRFMDDCVTDNVTGLNQVDERAKKNRIFCPFTRSFTLSLCEYGPFKLVSISLPFYPPKNVVSLHSHCDTRYTSKISDIFLRFLAKIPEADKTEEKREIISKQYCLLELVRWTGLWLWSACELRVRAHIKTKRSIRSRRHKTGLLMVFTDGRNSRGGRTNLACPQA